MNRQVEAFTPDETGIPASELRSFIERIERLNSEKDAIGDDIKDVFMELASRGYDKKAVRSVLKLRKLDPNERAESEAILDLYLSTLGMA